MATTHIVKQGEHLSRLAEHYGFADYRTIWEHPNNQALRELRENPHVLFPGDQIFIPSKEGKKEERHTGALHRFVVRRAKLMLRVVVRDEDDRPIANAPCELRLDGKSFKLTTNGEGQIEQEIPRTAEGGKLIIRAMEFPLKVGHLDPVDEPSGYRARLNNLGYNAGNSDDPEHPQLRSAIEEFQCDYKLGVDGVCGPQTQAKLKQVHGC